MVSSQIFSSCRSSTDKLSRDKLDFNDIQFPVELKTIHKNEKKKKKKKKLSPLVFLVIKKLYV